MRLPTDFLVAAEGQHALFTLGWNPLACQFGLRPNEVSLGAPEGHQVSGGQLFVVDLLTTPWETITSLLRQEWRSAHLLAEPVVNTLAHMSWRRPPMDRRGALEFAQATLDGVRTLRDRGLVSAMSSRRCKAIGMPDLPELWNELGLCVSDCDVEVRHIFEIREHLRRVDRLGADPLLNLCEVFGREPGLQMEQEVWSMLNSAIALSEAEVTRDYGSLGLNDAWSGDWRTSSSGADPHVAVRLGPPPTLGSLELLEAILDLASLTRVSGASAEWLFDASPIAQARGLALASLDLLERAGALQVQSEKQEAALTALQNQLSQIVAERDALRSALDAALGDSRAASVHGE